MSQVIHKTGMRVVVMVPYLMGGVKFAFLFTKDEPNIFDSVIKSYKILPTFVHDTATLPY